MLFSLRLKPTLFFNQLNILAIWHLLVVNIIFLLLFSRWDLSTPRVLTMDFVEGGQVNDLDYIKENKIDPFEISDKLGKMYSRMIFIHGFVHSDPHPGNILVKKSQDGSCNVVLLDHGLYAVSIL